MSRSRTAPVTAEDIAQLSAKVDAAALKHRDAKDAAQAASRRETERLNELRKYQRQFDEAVEDFKNDRSDNHNNRWGPKFNRAKAAATGL